MQKSDLVRFKQKKKKKSLVWFKQRKKKTCGGLESVQGESILNNDWFDSSKEREKIKFDSSKEREKYVEDLSRFGMESTLNNEGNVAMWQIHGE